MGDPRKGELYGGLGQLYHAQNNLEKARQYYEKAVSAQHNNHNPSQKALMMGNLGYILAAQGHLDAQTQQYLENAIIDLEQCEQWISAYCISSTLGLFLARKEDFEQSQLIFSRIILQLRKLERPIILGQVLCERGEAYFLSGHSTKARTAIEEAKAIVQQLRLQQSSVLAKQIEALEAFMSDES